MSTNDDLRVDFTGVESKNFDPLPAGWYPCYITDLEVKESGPQAKNPGSKYIAFEFTIVEGHANAERKFWANASLLPHALFTYKGIVDALGIKADGEYTFDPDDFLGKKIQVKAKVRAATEEYEAKNELKAFKAFGDTVDAAEASSMLP